MLPALSTTSPSGAMPCTPPSMRPPPLSVASAVASVPPLSVIVPVNGVAAVTVPLTVRSSMMAAPGPSSVRLDPASSASVTLESATF